MFCGWFFLHLPYTRHKVRFCLFDFIIYYNKYWRRSHSSFVQVHSQWTSEFCSVLEHRVVQRVEPASGSLSSDAWGKAIKAGCTDQNQQHTVRQIQYTGSGHHISPVWVNPRWKNSSVMTQQQDWLWFDKDTSTPKRSSNHLKPPNSLINTFFLLLLYFSSWNLKLPGWFSGCAA